jgi:hypothetical protein
MAISTETTSNSAALANPLVGGYLTPDVIITAPAHNAKLGPSFTITGTASCVARETTGVEYDATSSIAAVEIRLGGTRIRFRAPRAQAPARRRGPPGPLRQTPR